MHPGFPTFLRGLYVKYQYLRNLKCLRYPSNIPGSCIDIISLDYDHPCFTMYFQRTATRFLSNEVFLAFLFKPMFPQVCPRFSHGMDIEKKMYRCFPSLKTWENIMWNFSLRLFAESQVRRFPSGVWAWLKLQPSSHADNNLKILDTWEEDLSNGIGFR